jgi:hypothetical protein
MDDPMEADVGTGVIVQVMVDGRNRILFHEYVYSCLLFIWEVKVYVDEMPWSMILS